MSIKHSETRTTSLKLNSLQLKQLLNLSTTGVYHVDYPIAFPWSDYDKHRIERFEFGLFTLCCSTLSA